MLRKTRCQNFCAIIYIIHSFTTMQVTTLRCQTHATIRQCNFYLSYSHLAKAESFIPCSLVVHRSTFQVKSVIQNVYFQRTAFGNLSYKCPNH